MDDDPAALSRDSLLSENKLLILHIKKLYLWIDELEEALSEISPDRPKRAGGRRRTDPDEFEQLRHRLAEAENNLTAIQTSTTWRLTRPLRAILSTAKRYNHRVFR